MAKENDRINGDTYVCWTFCTERGRIKYRNQSPKFFRTIHEARAATLLDPEFKKPTVPNRKFFIAQVQFAVIYETLQEVKKPPKRRYIM
ncbi:MAG: hypothetical protein FJ351_06300 [Sphingomonadales bacterium]|nr:hypothetical protein [Sphingomonadales bacterium]